MTKNAKFEAASKAEAHHPNASARIAEASRLAQTSRARYFAFVGLAIVVQVGVTRLVSVS